MNNLSKFTYCKINVHSSETELAELWDPNTSARSQLFGNVLSKSVPNNPASLVNTDRIKSFLTDSCTSETFAQLTWFAISWIYW